MVVLPSPVVDEIFDLRHKVTDIALEHLFDDIENHGISVKQHFNYDHAIVIILIRTGDHPISGEIRIDRIRQIFDISLNVDGYVILPMSGDWGVILEYLQKAIAS
jgi:hypothetical protein